jgi:hypothetical protein
MVAEPELILVTSLVTTTPKTAYSCYHRNEETACNIEYLAFREVNNGLEVRVLPGSPTLLFSINQAAANFSLSERKKRTCAHDTWGV